MNKLLLLKMNKFTIFLAYIPTKKHNLYSLNFLLAEGQKIEYQKNKKQIIKKTTWIHHKPTSTLI
jgi:hypothetical protein